MDFIDEHDGAGAGFDLLDHSLQPLFKVTAIARASKQHAHVEHVDRAILQDIRNFALDDLARQSFCNGSFANAGIAHKQRIVLRTPAQDLNGAVDFILAANERINLAFSRFLVEVYAVGLKRITIAFFLGAHFGRITITTARLLILVNTAHRPRLAMARALGNAV